MREFLDTTIYNIENNTGRDIMKEIEEKNAEKDTR